VCFPIRYRIVFIGRGRRERMRPLRMVFECLIAHTHTHTRMFACYSIPTCLLVLNACIATARRQRDSGYSRLFHHHHITVLFPTYCIVPIHRSPTHPTQRAHHSTDLGSCEEKRKSRKRIGMLWFLGLVRFERTVIISLHRRSSHESHFCRY
jgi:hypothetical protein